MKNSKKINQLLTSLKVLVSSAIILPGSKKDKYKSNIRNYCISILYAVKNIERYFDSKGCITNSQLNLINNYFSNLNKLF